MLRTRSTSAHQSQSQQGLYYLWEKLGLGGGYKRKEGKGGGGYVVTRVLRVVLPGLDLGSSMTR